MQCINKCTLEVRDCSSDFCELTLAVSRLTCFFFCFFRGRHSDPIRLNQEEGRSSWSPSVNLQQLFLTIKTLKSHKVFVWVICSLTDFWSVISSVSCHHFKKRSWGFGHDAAALGKINTDQCWATRCKVYNKAISNVIKFNMSHETFNISKYHKFDNLIKKWHENILTNFTMFLFCSSNAKKWTQAHWAATWVKVLHRYDRFQSFRLQRQFMRSV